MPESCRLLTFSDRMVPSRLVLSCNMRQELWLKYQFWSLLFHHQAPHPTPCPLETVCPPGLWLLPSCLLRIPGLPFLPSSNPGTAFLPFPLLCQKVSESCPSQCPLLFPSPVLNTPTQQYFLALLGPHSNPASSCVSSSAFDIIDQALSRHPWSSKWFLPFFYTHSSDHLVGDFLGAGAGILMVPKMSAPSFTRRKNSRRRPGGKYWVYRKNGRAESPGAELWLGPVEYGFSHSRIPISATHRGL